ncbi:MAG: hypothetical protein J1F23_09020 [Oscillospiraceae bacterium]|nr:hypothetical protein [Oscillospiraceae bacterium]
MKQKIPRKKWLPILPIVILLVTLITASVVAKYIKNTADVKNTFKPAASVTPEIIEEFEEHDDTLKKNVHFKVGTTEYPVYVRAAIVITWQNEDGVVYFSEPNKAKPIYDEGIIIGYDGDYYIDLNSTDWEYNEDDGFYYYKSPVESGKETTNLIYECRQINAAPVEGYTLSVEIIVQTVQAIGYTDEDNPNGVIPAYQDAWTLYTEPTTTPAPSQP